MPVEARSDTGAAALSGADRRAELRSAVGNRQRLGLSRLDMLFEAWADWVLEHHQTCRAQDIDQTPISWLFSLAGSVSRLNKTGRDL
jgi:hypothetical protein